MARKRTRLATRIITEARKDPIFPVRLTRKEWQEVLALLDRREQMIYHLEDKLSTAEQQAESRKTHIEYLKRALEDAEPNRIAANKWKEYQTRQKIGRVKRKEKLAPVIIDDVDEDMEALIDLANRVEADIERSKLISRAYYSRK